MATIEQPQPQPEQSISEMVSEKLGKDVKELTKNKIFNEQELKSQMEVPQWNLNTFCVSGRICKNRLCISHLLDSDMRKINPANCFVTLMLCKPCYHSLSGHYKILFQFF